MRRAAKAVAAIVDRRLAWLERARGFIDWEKRKTFAADLRATLATITGELGPADPVATVDRLIRFLICAQDVFQRVVWTNVFERHRRVVLGAGMIAVRGRVRP